MRPLALAVLALPVLALGMPSSAAAQRKFSFAYDQPTTTAYGIAANIFDEKLKQLSGGKMSINQFPGAQLGTEPQTLQKMRAGDIDFVITSTANASSVAPQAGVFSLHFIFRDEAHLTRALADKEVAAAFRAMIRDSVQGGQVLGLLTMGFRNMYSKKEITKVEDIKGQKVRVQATKTEDTHFPAYGAQTVHMPFGEVYTSLQTATLVFGLITPPYGLSLLVASKFVGVPFYRAMFRSFPLYIVFFITIAFTVLFPDVVLWLPKWLLPQSVGCFPNPAGTGYICP